MAEKLKNYVKGKNGAITSILLIVFPLAVLFLGLSVGRIGLGIDEVFAALARLFTGSDPVDMSDVVVCSMRLPRLLLAALAGAGLSVSGAVFQGLFQIRWQHPTLSEWHPDRGLVQF